MGDDNLGNWNFLALHGKTFDVAYDMALVLVLLGTHSVLVPTRVAILKMKTNYKSC